MAATVYSIPAQSVMATIQSGSEHGNYRAESHEHAQRTADAAAWHSALGLRLQYRQILCVPT
jgi:hypothetical protein